MELRKGEWQLSIDSPNLNIIPNKNPIQMVQNKTHDEYAVFWPFEKIPEHSIEKTTTTNFASLGNDIKYPCLKKSFKQIGKGAKRIFHHSRPTGNFDLQSYGVWREATLIPSSGVIKYDYQDEGVKGLLFEIYHKNEKRKEQLVNFIDDQRNYEALPQCCPNCNSNFHSRTYVKSPVRSYRTGIAKSNQILLKSFYHQLTHENRKLISFSDSREDAAQFAYKTEQEHHRNTISDILLDIIYKESIEKGEKIEKYKKLISQYDDTKRIPKEEEFKGFIVEEIKEFRGLLRILKDEDAEIIEKDNANAFLDAKRNNSVGAIKLDDLLPSTNSVGLLIQELLQKGMNPSGVGKNKDYIDGKYWSSYFDFENKNFVKNINDSVRTHFIENIEADVCENLFSKLWFSFENAGIGIVKMMPDDELRKKLDDENIPKERIEDYLNLTNAFIRVLGENFRYKNPDSTIELNEINDGNFTSKINKWVEKAETKSLYPELQTIKRIIVSKHPGFIINPSELYFEPIKNPKESNFYECSKCKQIHLHNAGNICTFCNHAGTNEVPFYIIKGTVKSLQESNFIAQRLLSDDFVAHRMRLGELSGQTDNQPKRIMEFKGVILPEIHNDLQSIINNKKVQEIDVISVTTTMEVGVDIGSLQAVYQANMPPARYNYQQRVGRGGRRGQAYSAVLTFCRGKSHDNYRLNAFKY